MNESARPQRYTHGHQEPVLRSHRWRTAENSAAYLLPYLRADDTLLDVGAGPGTITADLAEHVHRVEATEIGPDQLALTRAEINRRQLTNVSCSVQDLAHLDLADDTFDVAHAHQVLQHVADPVGALAELGRVTRPGGLVAVRDCDYSGFVWWPRLPELDAWLDLYRQAARANGGEPDAGRRLLGWTRAAGLEVIRASSTTWCFATPEDRAWWGGLWADRMRSSAIAVQLKDTGLADERRLDGIADGWHRWAEHPDGWFSVLHGEILARPA